MVTEHADGTVYDRTKRSQVEPASPTIRAWHKKCHHVEQKRIKMGGDPEEGRMGPSIGAYEIAEAVRTGATAEISEQWQRRQEEIRQDREQDPGYEPRPESDWRDQTVVDLVSAPPEM
jgi:hypothetical protein